jgi:hypothetical protein
MDRVPVSEAAARLGVLYANGIRRGTIEYEKDADGRYYVYLTPHDGRHEWLRREVERKDTIIMQMAQRIPELEPARESPPEPREDPVSVVGEGWPGTDTPPEEERRPSLWRRLFGGPGEL